MLATHPNIDLIRPLPALIPNRLHEAKDRFADSFVWHYFNQEIPDLAGDYEGFDGLCAFFDKLGALTGGTFSVNAKDVWAIGDELVVAHANPAMTLEGQTFETDAAVVWRIVDGRIAEAWDIPALYNVRPKEV